MTPRGPLDVLAICFVFVCMAVFVYVLVQVLREEARARAELRRRPGYLFDRESERLP